MPSLALMASIFLANLAWTQPTAASCECGYLVSRGSTLTPQLFTNSIVTNFADGRTVDIGPDWQRSNYGIDGHPNINPPQLAQWYYPENVYKTSEGLVDGLAIRVKAYGGTGPVSGGGVAQGFFFYRDNNNEIDIEILSGDPNAIGGPDNLHFTNKPGITAAPAAGFDPAADFHDYRIDWIPGKSEMWVDSTLRSSHTTGVPTIAGEIVINCWSNGDPTWSQGPPTRDALLRVRKTALYFNHTNAAENAAFVSKCAKATGADRVCNII
ncbi:concanavalin A-like lectin/glucanase domain-containing protein [Jimgerdemannia flammicorona]|uniref:Concanavalin A-like lectin/glucanase domain-containing protein n=1 Tax=Jimgerdemannia flammicorona TaxID=994334 RepID=A0A433D5Z3_9FUNG|nr:concanavalin A-like lectin/glucanase domain-containing protein [Jimgerdemannia flammicorona]